MKSGETKKRLLVIDSNSLVHRAYHALPPLSTQKGEMVNAVYGFLAILMRAIKEFQPTYIAAAFDVAGPTFRHEQFKEYKAQRARAPQELYDQIPLVKEALDAFGVPVYEKEGFEADDIIGTIAAKVAKKENVETIIVSGDMDTLQLVDRSTKVYTMRKGVQDSVLYDEEAVKTKFGGLAPSQLADYKGLRGDPSDNIPGVSGIGEKTAIQLLQEFGSIEGLYRALKKKSKAIKPAAQKKIAQGEKEAYASRELARIDKHVPVAFEVKDCGWKTENATEVRKMLERFEFTSLLKRISGQGIRAGKQQQMFGEVATSSFEEKKGDALDKIKRLYQDNVFSKEVYKMEMDLFPVLQRMEQVGVKVDLPYLEELTEEMSQEILRVSKEIFNHAKKEFNINSTQQFSQVLFDRPPDGLGISPKGLKKTPKGVISTASPELEKLLEEHPIIAPVLRYREIQKLVTTYAKPLPRLADANGRVHTHFDQLGAATGRISSAEPNLQNIPNQGDWGKRIRRAFVAEQGFELVSFDYSQMELRIAAHVSGDPEMKKFFEQGADIHRMTAATVFGVPAGEVSPEMRFRAKALNFGVLYGMGAQGFAKSAGVSQEEARGFIEQYFIRFPGVQKYMEEVKERARSHGYVATMMGRKRYLPEIHSRIPQLRAAAERMAINHPIQGSLADIVKMAMIKVDAELQSMRGEARMLLQIHDELLFEMRSGILKKKGRRIQELMEGVCNLDVPVQVDMKKGINWSDVEKVS